MKLATFNINKDEGDFPKRIYDLSDAIKKHRVDIICLQEDYCAKEFHSAKCINLELDYHMVSSITRKKDRANILSSSNLTVLSKHPIRLLEEVYIHQGKENERCCQIVEVKHNAHQYLLLNTHLCHLSSRNRLEHLHNIFETIKKYFYEQIFFCGDFNALPLYQEICSIKEWGFETHNSQFTHEDKVILDYIFFKSRKKRLKVRSDIVLKNFSDHYCLVHHFSNF